MDPWGKSRVSVTFLDWAAMKPPPSTKYPHPVLTLTFNRAFIKWVLLNYSFELQLVHTQAMADGDRKGKEYRYKGLGERECCELGCDPPKGTHDALTPNVTIFRDGAFKEVNKVVRVGP